MILLSYKWYKSYFAIIITVSLVIAFLLLTGDIVYTLVSLLILSSFSWLYLSKYANSLYLDNGSIVVKSHLKIFFSKKIYNIVDIESVDINRIIKERRRWNVVIVEKSGNERVFYFQRITEEDEKKMRQVLINLCN